MSEIDPNVIRHFRWQDYCVFAGMLVVSSLIGVYHGWKTNRKNKKDSADTESGANDFPNASSEFLTAGGRMSTWPVAISMLASFLSSITLMGQPAEVYLFGPQLWLFGLAIFLSVPVVGYVMVPFFHKMQLTSAYEILYLALVLYAPALALHQVTGLNTIVVVTAMYAVVIFYTTVGGMKAVVWTDTFQVVVLYIAMLAVLIKGTREVGGFSVVWARNVDNDRGTFFNWNVDPTDRYTVWSTLIGAAMLHTSVYGANQLQVQRYLTVSTIKQAQKMVWINAFGWTAVVFLTVYAGMVIFAKYVGCDPLSTKVVSSPDQLFPLFVMDTSGNLPGFPGLFVAGIFSAGLSTVSTGLNSLAAIWYAELSGTRFREGPHNGGRMVKGLAFGFGLLSFVLVFAVPYMGGLAPVGIALSSFFSGAIFGLFMLGMHVPFANSIGAGCGLVLGVGVVGWMTVGSQWAKDHGQIVHQRLPLSADSCLANVTATEFLSTEEPARFDDDYALPLFRVSFLWYSFLSMVITISVGIIVSAVVALLERQFGLKLASDSDGQSTPETVPEDSKSFWAVSQMEDVALNKSDLPNKLLVKNGLKDTRALHLSIKGRTGTNGSRHI